MWIMTGEKIIMYRKFEGEIDGVTLDGIKEIFFDKYYDQGHSADERVEDVKKLILEQSNNFFGDYCCEQYLAKTPANQVMSEEDSVCHFMDVLAGYIITGDSESYPFDRYLFATNL